MQNRFVCLSSTYVRYDMVTLGKLEVMFERTLCGFFERSFSLKLLGDTDFEWLQEVWRYGSILRKLSEILL